MHGTLFYPYTCCTKREAQSENFLKNWPSLLNITISVSYSREILMCFFLFLYWVKHREEEEEEKHWQWQIFNKNIINYRHHIVWLESRCDWTLCIEILKQQSQENLFPYHQNCIQQKLKENDDNGRSFYYLDIVKVNWPSWLINNFLLFFQHNFLFSK